MCEKISLSVASLMERKKYYIILLLFGFKEDRENDCVEFDLKTLVENGSICSQRKKT